MIKIEDFEKEQLSQYCYYPTLNKEEIEFLSQQRTSTMKIRSLNEQHNSTSTSKSSGFIKNKRDIDQIQKDNIRGVYEINLSQQTILSVNNEINGIRIIEESENNWDEREQEEQKQTDKLDFGQLYDQNNTRITAFYNTKIDKLTIQKVVLGVSCQPNKEKEIIRILSKENITLPLVETSQEGILYEQIAGQKNFYELSQILFRIMQENDQQYVYNFIDFLFLKLFEKLQQMHILGYAHGDIKPQNIILGFDNEPYFIDFGSAQPLQDYQNYLKSYTKYYNLPKYFDKNQQPIKFQNEEEVLQCDRTQLALTFIFVKYCFTESYRKLFEKKQFSKENWSNQNNVQQTTQWDYRKVKLTQQEYNVLYRQTKSLDYLILDVISEKKQLKKVDHKVFLNFCYLFEQTKDFEIVNSCKVIMKSINSYSVFMIKVFAKIFEQVEINEKTQFIRLTNISSEFEPFLILDYVFIKQYSLYKMKSTILINLSPQSEIEFEVQAQSDDEVFIQLSKHSQQIVIDKICFIITQIIDQTKNQLKSSIIKIILFNNSFNNIQFQMLSDIANKFENVHISILLIDCELQINFEELNEFQLATMTNDEIKQIKRTSQPSASIQYNGFSSPNKIFSKKEQSKKLFILKESDFKINQCNENQDQFNVNRYQKSREFIYPENKNIEYDSDNNILLENSFQSSYQFLEEDQNTNQLLVQNENKEYLVENNTKELDCFFEEPKNDLSHLYSPEKQFIRNETGSNDYHQSEQQLLSFGQNANLICPNQSASNEYILTEKNIYSSLLIEAQRGKILNNQYQEQSYQNDKDLRIKFREMYENLNYDGNNTLVQFYNSKADIVIENNFEKFDHFLKKYDHLNVEINLDHQQDKKIKKIVCYWNNINAYSIHFYDLFFHERVIMMLSQNIKQIDEIQFQMTQPNNKSQLFNGMMPTQQFSSAELVCKNMIIKLKKVLDSSLFNISINLNEPSKLFDKHDILIILDRLFNNQFNFLMLDFEIITEQIEEMKNKHIVKYLDEFIKFIHSFKQKLSKDKIAFCQFFQNLLKMKLIRYSMIDFEKIDQILKRVRNKYIQNVILFLKQSKRDFSNEICNILQLSDQSLLSVEQNFQNVTIICRRNKSIYDFQIMVHNNPNSFQWKSKRIDNLIKEKLLVKQFFDKLYTIKKQFYALLYSNGDKMINIEQERGYYNISFYISNRPIVQTPSYFLTFLAKYLNDNNNQLNKIITLNFQIHPKQWNKTKQIKQYQMFIRLSAMTPEINYWKIKFSEQENDNIILSHSQRSLFKNDYEIKIKNRFLFDRNDINSQFFQNNFRNQYFLEQNILYGGESDKKLDQNQIISNHFE